MSGICPTCRPQTKLVSFCRSILPEQLAAKTAEIEAVLGLLEGSLPGGVAIVARPLAPDRIRVADAYRRPDLIGSEITILPGLLTQGSQTLATEGVRLPLAWTLACGRPTFFASATVPGHPLEIVAAACGNLPPDLDQVAAAARVIGQLLTTGKVTHAERDTSRRIASLVHNLAVPFVFVDSRGLETFMNEQARELLYLSDAAQLPAVAAALKGIINEPGTEDREPEFAADPKARAFPSTSVGRNAIIRWKATGSTTTCFQGASGPSPM